MNDGISVSSNVTDVVRGAVPPTPKKRATKLDGPYSGNLFSTWSLTAK